MKSQQFPEATGSFWRADTGYRNARTATVADVIDYEINELGNAYDFQHITPEAREELKTIPASHCVWVTKIKSAAKFYGRPERYDVGQGAVILAEDRCQGYLVLLNPTTNV